MDDGVGRIRSPIILRLRQRDLVQIVISTSEILERRNIKDYNVLLMLEINSPLGAGGKKATSR